MVINTPETEKKQLNRNHTTLYEVFRLLSLFRNRF